MIEIKRIFSYAKPLRWFLYLSLISYFISSFLYALIPLYIGRAIDVIIGVGQVNFAVLLKYIIYLAGFQVFAAIFDWLATVFENRLSYGAARKIRLQLLQMVML